MQFDDSISPLLGALASMRLKMTRQTMRFLGDSGRQRPHPATEPVPAEPAEPPAEGTRQGERPTRAAPTAQSRRRSWRRSVTTAPGRWPRRRSKSQGQPPADICRIRLLSPSVRIELQRADEPTPRMARFGAGAVVLIRVKGPAGPARPTTRPLLQSAEPSSSELEPSPSAEAPEQQTKDQTAVAASPTRELARNTTAEVPQETAGENKRMTAQASTESLNSYVRRKTSALLHQVAKNIRWFETNACSLSAASSEERLRVQVSRVAAYTAASRHLRHATNLYVVADVESRRLRRGWVRYRKLDCPLRAMPLQPPPPSLTPQQPALSRSNVPGPLTESEADKKLTTASPIHINDLSKVILMKIFGYLNQRELSVNAAPVCRAWHRLARSRQFWRELTFDATFHQYSASSLCQLLSVTPGLWTLELIACRDVDVVLTQVHQTCRKLRTLVLDSCKVSTQLQNERQGARREGKNVNGNRTSSTSVLDAVLEQCICLQYLIVAFTPYLYSATFFALLGRRCWSLQCFLVSADDADVRQFCESLFAEDGEASETLLGSLTGSWTRTVPPPSTASDNCHCSHPPSETSGLRRRVTAVRTRNRFLRVLALRPHAELRLLQWRLTDRHATLEHFGAEARLS